MVKKKSNQKVVAAGQGDMRGVSLGQTLLGSDECVGGDPMTDDITLYFTIFTTAST